MCNYTMRRKPGSPRAQHQPEQSSSTIDDVPGLGTVRSGRRHRSPGEVAGRIRGLLERDDLYLIPTSEVPVANLHRGEILADTTPAKLVAAAGAANVEEAFLSMTVRAAERGNP